MSAKQEIVIPKGNDWQFSDRNKLARPKFGLREITAPSVLVRDLSKDIRDNCMSRGWVFTSLVTMDGSYLLFVYINAGQPSTLDSIPEPEAILSKRMLGEYLIPGNNWAIDSKLLNRNLGRANRVATQGELMYNEWSPDGFARIYYQTGVALALVRSRTLEDEEKRLTRKGQAVVADANARIRVIQEEATKKIKIIEQALREVTDLKMTDPLSLI